jgi:hypothetical protein
MWLFSLDTQFVHQQLLLHNACITYLLQLLTLMCQLASAERLR